MNSGRLKQFQVTFALANDGIKAIDAEVKSWRLVVNAIQEWFKTPGTYTIVWRGDGFESAPVVFRVLKQEQ